METKKWSKCNVVLPLSSFYHNKGTKDGHHHYCIDCHNNATKIHYHTNPDAKMKAKNKNILHNYGVSIDVVRDMFNSQGGLCAICGKQLQWGKNAYVDHCHSTNKIRGLLCPTCNTMIGLAKDNIIILESAIIYLEKTFVELVKSNK
jgi:DNA-directed RNA polymerase subunit RPC12/RpoP